MRKPAPIPYDEKVNSSHLTAVARASIVNKGYVVSYSEYFLKQIHAAYYKRNNSWDEYEEDNNYPIFADHDAIIIYYPRRLSDEKGREPAIVGYGLSV